MCVVSGGSRIFEGGVAGVEYGGVPKARAPRGVREILKSQVSEMAFPAF